MNQNSFSSGFYAFFSKRPLLNFFDDADWTDGYMFAYTTDYIHRGKPKFSGTNPKYLEWKKNYRSKIIFTKESITNERSSSLR